MQRNDPVLDLSKYLQEEFSKISCDESSNALDSYKTLASNVPLQKVLGSHSRHFSSNSIHASGIDDAYAASVRSPSSRQVPRLSNRLDDSVIPKCGSSCEVKLCRKKATTMINMTSIPLPPVEVCSADSIENVRSKLPKSNLGTKSHTELVSSNAEEVHIHKVASTPMELRTTARSPECVSKSCVGFRCKNTLSSVAEDFINTEDLDQIRNSAGRRKFANRSISPTCIRDKISICSEKEEECCVSLSQVNRITSVSELLGTGSTTMPHLSPELLRKLEECSQMRSESRKATPWSDESISKTQKLHEGDEKSIKNTEVARLAMRIAHRLNEAEEKQITAPEKNNQLMKIRCAFEKLISTSPILKERMKLLKESFSNIAAEDAMESCCSLEFEKQLEKMPSIESLDKMMILEREVSEQENVLANLIEELEIIKCRESRLAAKMSSEADLIEELHQLKDIIDSKSEENLVRSVQSNTN